MLNWIVLNRTDYLHKMDLALNNIHRLICHKNQPTNQPSISLYFFFHAFFFFPFLCPFCLSFLFFISPLLSCFHFLHFFSFPPFIWSYLSFLFYVYFFHSFLSFSLSFLFFLFPLDLFFFILFFSFSLSFHSFVFFFPSLIAVLGFSSLFLPCSHHNILSFCFPFIPRRTFLFSFYLHYLIFTVFPLLNSFLLFFFILFSFFLSFFLSLFISCLFMKNFWLFATKNPFQKESYWTVQSVGRCLEEQEKKHGRRGMARKFKE